MLAPLKGYAVNSLKFVPFVIPSSVLVLTKHFFFFWAWCFGLDFRGNRVQDLFNFVISISMRVTCSLRRISTLSVSAGQVYAER